VTLSRHEEESLYKGDPIIVPRYSFHVTHSPSKPDPSLPFLKRFASKCVCITKDTKEYILDILFNRQAEFSFKTAYFVKRHKKCIGHTLHHIWEELVKVGIGFKMLNADFKYYWRWQHHKVTYKYDKPTFKQTVKLG
jgi:hypothetical protein